MANCARITARDILATNGIVHVVDKVNIVNFVFVIIVFGIAVVVTFVIVVVVIFVVVIVIVLVMIAMVTISSPISIPR